MVVHEETTFFNARVLIGLYLGPLYYETACTGSTKVLSLALQGC